MMLEATTLLTTLFLFSVASAERVFVKNVPYHRQVTEFTCGSASLCMAIEHAWGRALQAEGALDQLAVVDVARTDSQVGIFVHDVPRVARFSVLSGCPAGDPLFPAHAPKAGWWGALCAADGVGHSAPLRDSCRAKAAHVLDPAAAKDAGSRSACCCADEH